MSALAIHLTIVAGIRIAKVPAQEFFTIVSFGIFQCRERNKENG